MTWFTAEVELVTSVEVEFEAKDDEAPGQVAITVALDELGWGGRADARVVRIDKRG